VANFFSAVYVTSESTEFSRRCDENI